MNIPIGKYMHAEHLGCEPEVYTIHCDQCKKHSTRLTAEAVDSGQNDSAPVDGDGERS